MKHDVLKRLNQLEQRQPQHIIVRAKDQDENVRKMSVDELITTKSEFMGVISGSRVTDLDAILEYVMPDCVI